MGKQNFQAWYDELLRLAKKNNLEWLVSLENNDVDELRDAFEMGYTPNSYFSEMVSVSMD